MGRTANLKKKEKRILDVVHQLFEANHTLDEVLAHLREMGIKDVSRSALGRHRKEHEEAVAEVRRHEALSEKLVKEFGQGSSHKAMRANIAVMHALISKLSDVLAMRHVDDMDIQDIARLSQSLASLGRAAKSDTEVLAKLREEAREEARKELIAETKTAVRDANVDESAASAIMEHLESLKAKEQPA